LAAPADAVKLFTEKIKPVEALDPKRIQRLLADLGSDEFAVREAASKTLQGLNEQTIPYLEETLKNTASAKMKPTTVARLLVMRSTRLIGGWRPHHRPRSPASPRCSGLPTKSKTAAWNGPILT
jgi:hypothetical protein